MSVDLDLCRVELMILDLAIMKNIINEPDTDIEIDKIVDLLRNFSRELKGCLD